MTKPESLTYEDLQERVTSLLDLTRMALESDERAASLAASLPVLDDLPVRIALAGAHNAGKSMLIAALLKLPQDEVDAITAATPFTSEITPYSWSDYVLLDLPGTLSGLDEHDDVAAAGVRRADLLLLVTSVELPGEAETRQINHLLTVEGFARRTLVVLNKCNTEDNDPELIRSEMLDRLNSYPWIELLFADAKEHVESLNVQDLTQEDRAFLREGSGIDEVETALGALAAEHGRTARLQAMCQEVRRASEDASNLWEPDQEEEADAIAADRIRAAFTAARADLTEVTNLAYATLADAITGVGTDLAAAVSEEDGSLEDRSISAAGVAEEKAASKCAEDVNRAVDDIFGRLDTNLGATLEDRDRYSIAANGIAPGIRRDRVNRERSKFDDAVDKAVDKGVGKLRTRFTEAIDAGVREGSPFHDMAKKLNAMRKVPIKPYTHRHKAEELAKRAKQANAAAGFLGPLIDVKGSFDNLRRGAAIKKRREDIRSEYATHAVAVVSQERREIDEYLERRLARRRDVIGAMLEVAEESAKARTQAQDRWGALSVQARDHAALVDHALVR